MSEIETAAAPSVGEPLAKVAKHQSSVEIIPMTGQEDLSGTGRTYEPPTEDEAKILNSITNELFESMTGFKGLVVLSLAERLARVRICAPIKRVTANTC